MFDKAVQLYESGMTQVEVANTLGTTQKVIWGLFNRNGYKCRVAKKRNQTGESNDSWKGDGAGYSALHYRVGNVRGKPSFCVMCESEVACQWANVSGKFENVYDYIRLCASCHSVFDKKIRNINKGRSDDNEIL